MCFGLLVQSFPARTLQIAIIDCIFWFHSRASNFQQVWEKKGAEPQCNIAFLQVVPSIHVAVIAASSCHKVGPTRFLQVWDISLQSIVHVTLSLL